MEKDLNGVLAQLLPVGSVPNDGAAPATVVPPGRGPSGLGLPNGSVSYDDGLDPAVPPPLSKEPEGDHFGPAVSEEVADSRRAMLARHLVERRSAGTSHPSADGAPVVGRVPVDFAGVVAKVLPLREAHSTPDDDAEAARQEEEGSYSVIELVEGIPVARGHAVPERNPMPPRVRDDRHDDGDAPELDAATQPLTEDDVAGLINAAREAAYFVRVSISQRLFRRVVADMWQSVEALQFVSVEVNDDQVSALVAVEDVVFRARARDAAAEPVREGRIEIELFLQVAASVGGRQERFDIYARVNTQFDFTTFIPRISWGPGSEVERFDQPLSERQARAADLVLQGLRRSMYAIVGRNRTGRLLTLVSDTRGFGTGQPDLRTLADRIADPVRAASLGVTFGAQWFFQVSVGERRSLTEIQGHLVVPPHGRSIQSLPPFVAPEHARRLLDVAGVSRGRVNVAFELPAQFVVKLVEIILSSQKRNVVTGEEEDADKPLFPLRQGDVKMNRPRASLLENGLQLASKVSVDSAIGWLDFTVRFTVTAVVNRFTAEVELRVARRVSYTVWPGTKAKITLLLIGTLGLGKLLLRKLMPTGGPLGIAKAIRHGLLHYDGSVGTHVATTGVFWETAALGSEGLLIHGAADVGDIVQSFQCLLKRTDGVKRGGFEWGYYPHQPKSRWLGPLDRLGGEALPGLNLFSVALDEVGHQAERWRFTVSDLVNGTPPRLGFFASGDQRAARLEPVAFHEIRADDVLNPPGGIPDRQTIDSWVSGAGGEVILAQAQGDISILKVFVIGPADVDSQELPPGPAWLAARDAEDTVWGCRNPSGHGIICRAVEYARPKASASIRVEGQLLQAVERVDVEYPFRGRLSDTVTTTTFYRYQAQVRVQPGSIRGIGRPWSAFFELVTTSGRVVASTERVNPGVDDLAATFEYLPDPTDDRALQLHLLVRLVDGFGRRVENSVPAGFLAPGVTYEVNRPWLIRELEGQSDAEALGSRVVHRDGILNAAEISPELRAELRSLAPAAERWRFNPSVDPVKDRPIESLWQRVLVLTRDGRVEEARRKIPWRVE